MNETKPFVKDEDEVNSVFENTRRGMRQPKRDQKDETESVSVPRRMMPPINRKNETQKS